MYKVFNAQKENTTKGDWYEVIQDDLKISGLDQYNEAQIKAFSKQQWKSIVKKAITEQAFQELTLEAKGKSKTKELKYSTLDIQEYLKTDKIKFRTKLTLLKCRLKMAKVGYNYGNKEECPLCENNSPDQQEHLLACEKIRNEMEEDLFTNIDHKDIYNSDISKMKTVGEVLEKVLRKRKEIVGK